MQVLKDTMFLALLLFSVFLTGCGCSTIQPGERGIKITTGEPENLVRKEGLVWHAPFFTSVETVNIKQRTETGKTACFSSDLQTVTLEIAVLYRLPEAQVFKIITEYSGNIFETIILPNAQEALKEHTALYSAENITKKREEIKTKTLESLKKKVGGVAIIEDIIIKNIDLSDELEKAIEQKMVQQQEAAKSQFTKEKAVIDAETALIVAEGEAKAIAVRGAAIKNNPGLIDLQIVEKWDGKTPQTVVVGSGQAGANILLPLAK